VLPINNFKEHKKGYFFHQHLTQNINAIELIITDNPKVENGKDLPPELWKVIEIEMNRTSKIKNVMSSA